MRNLIVGIDIGGTKIAGGLVNHKGRLLDSLTVPTQAEKATQPATLGFSASSSS